MTQLVDTLQLFHNNFFIHRDLKIDNILVQSVNGEKINVVCYSAYQITKFNSEICSIVFLMFA